MSQKLPRRNFLGAAGAFALTPSLARSAAASDWPPSEGQGTPRLCLGTGPSADEKQMRRFRQIGIDHVLMGARRSRGTRRTCERSWNASAQVASPSPT
jgi:hypothetical protein